MTITTTRQFLSIAFFSAACTWHSAHAEQAPVPAFAPDQLAIVLPDIDHEALVEAIETLRSQLIQRKNELTQDVTDRKLDGNDALITAIMPGGLLYAGYKKARLEQAKNELASVSADIEEFSDDLLAMESMSAPVFVAQLP